MLISERSGSPCLLCVKLAVAKVLLYWLAHGRETDLPEQSKPKLPVSLEVGSTQEAAETPSGMAPLVVGAATNQPRLKMARRVLRRNGRLSGASSGGDVADALAPRRRP